MKRAAIYAFYDPHGVVADYVVYMLKHLRAHADLLVVVCNGQVNAEGQKRLAEHADSVHLRENVGFDIHGFRAGLIEYIGWDKLAGYDEVVLLNSTFYGPIFPLAEMFGTMDRRTSTDFWGITAFKGPVPNGFTGVGMLPFHIQSYFMAFRKRVYATKAFQEYWRKLPVLKTYVDAVLIHETQFTELLSNQGFRYSLYCDPKDYGAINPSFDMLDVLLERRCPVLKRRAFFHEPLYLDLNNVELARAIDLIRKRSDYDTGLIWSDITKIAKPHDLYTNATLLEVPAGRAAPKLNGKKKVAVLAHVTSVALFEELAAHLKHIPVPYDLHLTTADASLVAALEKAAGAQVRPVEPRGGEVAALLVGQRDLLRDGGYDWICRLHTSPSTGTAFPRSRHFRQHHYENLLGDRTYVARLLEMFERDPSIGVIVPPAVHIAHSSARLQHDAGAAKWAKKLGIQAPLDTYTPEMPTGSMFWCRPEALGILTRADFKLSDFGGVPKDGGEPLEKILLRLLLPAVQQSGYYAKSVLTPANLAKNYVKLEYKVQQAIGAPKPQPAAGPQGPRFPFPEAQISEFVRARLKDKPVALGMAERALKFVTQRVNRGAAR